MSARSSAIVIILPVVMPERYGEPDFAAARLREQMAREVERFAPPSRSRPKVVELETPKA